MADIIAGIHNDLSLAIEDGKFGDTLNIELSEDPQSQVFWRVLVDVQTDEGRYRVGQFLTTAPFGRLNPGSRVIGFATCPGARRWFVSVFGANVPIFPILSNIRAQLYLSTSSFPPSTPGVVVNNPGASI